MEKRFIVINCEELDDQFECDAYRTIMPQLYTKEEVKELGCISWYDIVSDQHTKGSY